MFWISGQVSFDGESKVKQKRMKVWDNFRDVWKLGSRGQHKGA